MRTLTIHAARETWPLRQAFRISRGSKTTADVITVSVSDGRCTGHGEAVPYARYGETVEAALAALNDLGNIADRHELQSRMPPGAARNALDCALVDLEAKATGRSAAEVLGLAAPRPVLTAYTLSLDTPEAMAAAAASVGHLPLLKLKLGGAGDDARMRAVRHARPGARLIADANEAWTADLLAPLIQAAHATGMEVVEQPLPDGADEALRGVRHLVPICADESLHTRAGLARLTGLYDALNIKLDKAGGITEALALKRAAEAAGFAIMIGSMVATSLAVAPAMLLAQGAKWVDLDGPLLLARDRTPAIAIAHGIMSPPEPALWG